MEKRYIFEEQETNIFNYTTIKLGTEMDGLVPFSNT